MRKNIFVTPEDLARDNGDVELAIGLVLCYERFDWAHETITPEKIELQDEDRNTFITINIAHVDGGLDLEFVSTP